MKVRTLAWACAMALLASSASVSAQNILNVVETGGDNEATDTITAKWTGQTFNVSVANEPYPGATVSPPTTFTVPFFGLPQPPLNQTNHYTPAFVDRNHRYADTSALLQIPEYLIGGEYIMSGNDNRDNGAYRLDVTIAHPSFVYMLIDNRMSAETGPADEANPPTFDSTHMQWILDQGWAPSITLQNRVGDDRPDEVAIDEGADGGLNQWFSVYANAFEAGTFSLFQADNANQNMYGVVVVAIPEPGSLSLLGLAAAGLLIRRRSTN